MAEGLALSDLGISGIKPAGFDTMTENHSGLPARKYNLSRSRTPVPVESPPQASLSTQNLIYLRSQQGTEDVNSSYATSVADNDESLDSLMEALEFVHPARLSAKQRIFRDTHMRTKQIHHFTNSQVITQKNMDITRSKPLRPTKKAVCRPSRSPSLYPNYKKAHLYEQLAVGVKVGPPHGKEMKEMHSSRDLTYDQLEGAWKGSLRSLANHTCQTSTRLSSFSMNRGTVMGAPPQDKRLNSYNRYSTSDGGGDRQMGEMGEQPSKDPQTQQDNIWYEG